MTIWKFPLESTDEQTITVPAINRPLCVQVQHGKPCLWMMVNPLSDLIKVRVRIFGTGHGGVTPEMDYVGTYQLSGGMTVLHMFLAGVIA